MKYYIHVLKNYVNFSGRARRAEYWNYALINWLIGIVLMIPVLLLFADFPNIDLEKINTYSLPYTIYALATFLPSLAVLVRRLHDVEKSGWYFLIALIPFVGPIILLFKLFKAGTVGMNQYGEDPKGNGSNIENFGKPEVI